MSITTLNDAMQLSLIGLSMHVRENPRFWAQPDVIFPFILAHNIHPERISLEDRVYPVIDHDGTPILMEGWVGQTLFIHQQESEIRNRSSSLFDQYVALKHRMINLPLFTRLAILGQGNALPHFAITSEVGTYNTLGETMVQWFTGNLVWIQDDETLRAIIADQENPFQQQILAYAVKSLLQSDNKIELSKLMLFGLDLSKLFNQDPTHQGNDVDDICFVPETIYR